MNLISLHDRMASLAWSVAEITDNSAEYSDIVGRNYKENHYQQERRYHVGHHACNDIGVQMYVCDGTKLLKLMEMGRVHLG